MNTHNDKVKSETWAAMAAQIYCEQTGETIAVLPGVRCDEPTPPRALLMASAPDLLEACKEIQPHLTEYVQWHHKFDGGCSVEIENALDTINEAIARAEGRQ